jgi:hypothetical protein
MSFAYIIYLDMRIVTLMIWHKGHLVIICKYKKFHVQAKPMLKDEKILLCTEPDGLTTTTAGLITTHTSQITTRRSQTTVQAGQSTTQASSTAGTQGAVTLQSRD